MFYEKQDRISNLLNQFKWIKENLYSNELIYSNKFFDKPNKISLNYYERRN